MRKVLCVLSILLMILVRKEGLGESWYVDGSVSESGEGTSPESAFKTIQEGIDAASDGDMVVVAEGTYIENIRFKGHNIVLTNTDPGDTTVVESTIIDGNEAGPVVTFTGTENETCVLSGLTIRNGSAEYGGGICGGTLRHHTDATIENSIITENSATRDGGGLAFCDGLITNNTITRNRATADGGGLSNCHGVIQENSISTNSASSGGGGLSGCGGTIRVNIISSNHSQWGGGLEGCTGTIENNTIASNSCGYDGGGLFSCHGTIHSNSIVGNSAGIEGGGMAYCDGAIQNNTIVGNSAVYGGGLWFCYASIRNCIIWGNTAIDPQLRESSRPAYSCIQDWDGGGEGNITDAPHFADPNGPDDKSSTYGDNDYHLLSESPCIDAGNNEGWMWGAVDLDAKPRIINTNVDMGAYEYGTAVDTRPPDVWGRHPGSNAIHVPKSTNIVLHVKDYGSGVDEMSIVMTVNGVEVTPAITGAPTDYTVSYDPPSDFAHTETVTVTVNAADLSSPANVMERVTYSFTTIREPSPAATWYVDGSVSASGDGTSRETAFKEIQEGIDVASDGDTVIVAQATYVESINFNGKNIVLCGIDPTDPAVVQSTIIDGRQVGSVLTFAGTEDETCVLSGFTIRNGSADYGGGICGGTLLNHTRATIEHNIISRNSAAQDGGGLAFCDGVIRQNTLTDNRAAVGGGALWNCHGEIQSNLISGNSAKKGAGLSTCDGMIQGNTISDNSASTFGGGLFLCDAAVQGNVISSNNGGVYGGGVYDCDGPIRNNLITQNRVYWSGSGLERCNGAIQNNTIVGNSADHHAGALSESGGTIRNCIIWGNTSPVSDHLYRSSTPAFSCIEDWKGGGEGNISERPGFEKGSHRLKADSPCIDAGANEPWMSQVVDLEGNPRLWGDSADMGAYEFGSFLFNCVEVVRIGDETEITWNSRPGDNYTIWSCCDLLSGEWGEEETIPSAGQATGWTDPDTTSAHKFYRIELK